ncbi:MAG TPA: hypothetical protein VMM56_06850 [Planctomycetaceae bacterium]|nr:hypothetical protein [Planctomycetaceae bacterium]
MSESDTPASTEQSASEQFRSLALWILTTLAAGVLLALLLGSATPRIRLLGIYPLAIGAFVAFGALGLMVKFELNISKLSFSWMILLAMAVVAGSTCWSWSLWENKLSQEFASEYSRSKSRMDFILKEIDPAEQEKLHREHLLRFRESVTFQAYLSDRLKAFSEQLGRKNVWDRPIPEVIFGFELLLTLVGAWIVILQGTREPSDE